MQSRKQPCMRSRWAAGPQRRTLNALLWSAEDMDPVADSDLTYVPTQLYPAQPVHCPQSLSPLAKRRWRLMAATVHNNATVGKIYIGDCREPLEWAGEHVEYVIDASDGRSNV